MRIVTAAVIISLFSGCATLKGGLDNRITPPPSAGPLDLDLSKLPTDSAVIPVAAGTYSVRLLNLAPARSYAITIEVESTVPRPVDLPAQPSEVKTAFRNPAAPTPCELLSAAMTDLRNEADETLVPARIDAVRALISGCTPLRSEAERRIANTQRIVEPVRVNQGQTLTVRIARRDDPQIRWVRTYSGGRRGEWRTTYGFNYIWGIVSEEKRFFLEETDTDGSYIVRSRRSQDKLFLTPTLFYTWMPENPSASGWSHSPTVGLGFDLQAPVVSAGYAWTYNHNITFSTGFSLHQVQRLNEQYRVGGIVTDVKVADALSRSVYRINPYIAVSIRSLTNPFQPANPD